MVAKLRRGRMPEPRENVQMTAATMEPMAKREPRAWNGEKLRAARERKGWSTKKLAGELECAEQTVKDMEAGKYGPGSTLLARLGDVLGLKSVDPLFRK